MARSSAEGGAVGNVNLGAFLGVGRRPKDADVFVASPPASAGGLVVVIGLGCVVVVGERQGEGDVVSTSSPPQLPLDGSPPPASRERLCDILRKDDTSPLELPIRRASRYV